VSPKRRVHLGIDYGTSSSKIVFRDYGAPGGETAVVVVRDGSFRIPSRVCLTASDLLFGDEQRTTENCDIYESVKMQVAAEVSNNPRHYYGPLKAMPSGFASVDLAALTVWFLISEGHRAVAAYLKGRMDLISVGMTMGVPMAFFKDRQLRSTFLGIPRRAWMLYRGEGLLGSALLRDKALWVLDKYPLAAVPETREEEVRDWVRSEGEAAMWWPFQSPAVAPGRYAKVDIGAGTSHSSFFQIFGNMGIAKTGMAFLSAASESVGMDAVDRAIAESEELGGDCLALRGLEQSILQKSAKARGALIPVRDGIYHAFRKGWIETHQKIKQSVAEVQSWRDVKLFVIGGGSLIPTIAEAFKVHPAGVNPMLQLVVLEQPPELVRADAAKVSKDELPFVTVAYGLSNIGLSIPEALTPDQVPPMREPTQRRKRLDHEDIYAK